MQTKHFIKLPAYRDAKVEKDLVNGDENFRIYHLEIDKITIDFSEIQAYLTPGHDEYSEYIDAKTGNPIDERKKTAVFLKSRQGTLHIAMAYEDFDTLFQGIAAQNNIEYTDLT